jgi:hypothetical protein
MVLCGKEAIIAEESTHLEWFLVKIEKFSSDREKRKKNIFFCVSSGKAF